MVWIPARRREKEVAIQLLDILEIRIQIQVQVGSRIHKIEKYTKWIKIKMQDGKWIIMIREINVGSGLIREIIRDTGCIGEISKRYRMNRGDK